MERLNPRRLVIGAIAVMVAGLLVAIAAPASAFRATPSGDPTSVSTGIIFGFGFERDEHGAMTTGDSNRFLLDWTIDTMPHLTTLFVQEGVWVAACEQRADECRVGSTRLLRIDRHDDDVDLHTLDIAACALERMTWFDQTEAVIIAHDMQLARATENVERVRDAGLCRDCRFVVADVPDTPYPARSSQLRNRHETIYKWTDVAARLRFAPWVVGDPPQTCPMPMARPDT